ncbi:tRNA pseudouridine(38-40) synthase [Rhinocladiella mackenziei CBS 650.93]|uniref:Rhinocladiella mackenziei CBS 650.93 unplaced genomic scaffold supercont1.5, whole genome shotgun sequence n=1 Tax=Rhinocladiella mackenziei CBS 650.93 TaxID=1442369 RepID=A0A0D2IIW2_9EURO|nr:tRNA pseudouridine(38-40) synthase [Rhinocladiella mackenziei CBS 650.93]KIX03231.1 tRNA pseudouridine(38-40) synthase [Rhinocladiella mackenziei CBS 650.93]
MATNHGSCKATEQNPQTTNYTAYSNAELITRITALERQLREQTERLATLTTSTSNNTSSASSLPTQLQPPSTTAPLQRRRSESPSRRTRTFDPRAYSTRHIALKFAYLGGRYNGYEHANGNVLPKPTIEEVLWKALRKARLISPPVEDGADASMNVVWEEERRFSMYAGKGEGEGESRGHGRDEGKEKDGQGKVRLDLNWEGCQYSKCGRTDKGVSAFGQVIGIRVRSNRPIQKEEDHQATKSSRENGHIDRKDVERSLSGKVEDAMPSIDADDLEAETYVKPFDPIKDELSYVSILNAILPPDIRILAWCPDPPPTFDARFSCRERRYKYFFTNPAFCPTPGPSGMRDAKGNPAEMREGWLDIDKMRVAAKKLEGRHDFRNLCRIDPSKQMSSCERRVTFADVLEFEEPGRAFGAMEGLNQFASPDHHRRPVSPTGGPKVYTFCVHGTAFLWHQVRCMVAVLFLVGQGLEEPSIIDELLDVEKNPCRPLYEMADDAPLVLWDCVFPDDETDMKDSMKWLYAGDAANVPALTTTKSDGKFGVGAVVDELWSQWRKARIQETLAGSLLDLAISQGDGTSLQRDSQREPRNGLYRSQKIFDGSETARLVGKYVPVMKKPKMDSLPAQNAKWANGRQSRREGKSSLGTNGEESGRA